MPLIGVPREDFALRTDAAWLFADLGGAVHVETFVQSARVQHFNLRYVVTAFKF